MRNSSWGNQITEDRLQEIIEACERLVKLIGDFVPTKSEIALKNTLFNRNMRMIKLEKALRFYAEASDLDVAMDGGKLAEDTLEKLKI